MSTLVEELKISYREEEGLFYPNIIFEDEKDIATGKYGDLWMNYMKENCPEKYRHFVRIGCIRKKAAEVNEDAYKLLYGIMASYLDSHVASDPKSTMENWKLREQAKQIAEEIVLHDIVYCYH